MDWTQQFDGYCERTDFTYWSEPLNAVTNAAFLIAAFVMWRRTRGAGLILADILVAILAAIGVGSYLFHTHATAWALLADVAPIGIFILVYLFAVWRDMLEVKLWMAILGTLAFIPFAGVVVPIIDRIPFFQISNFYWTVPILLIAFAPFVARRNPATARGMLIGCAILALSITLRSVDEMLCDAFPTGTHIFWHCLNGLMLGWMIEVYRRHMVASRAAEG